MDFASEKGALATLVESRGHILILSPKYHPELGGCGIEYAWGKSKQWFRANNNQMAKDLHMNIENSMSEIVLPISRCWKFERKTRDYRRLYRDVAIQIEKGEMKLEEVTYKALENILESSLHTRNRQILHNKHLRRLSYDAFWRKKPFEWRSS